MEDVKKQLINLLEDLASYEVVEAMAEVCWKFYSKLIEKGFSKSEAVTLVASFNQGQK